MGWRLCVCFFFFPLQVSSYVLLILFLMKRRIYVDTRLHHMLDLTMNIPFFQRGDFPGVVQNGSEAIILADPWTNGTKAAPFDQCDFFFFRLGSPLPPLFFSSVVRWISRYSRIRFLLKFCSVLSDPGCGGWWYEWMVSRWFWETLVRWFHKLVLLFFLSFFLVGWGLMHIVAFPFSSHAWFLESEERVVTYLAC